MKTSSAVEPRSTPFRLLLSVAFLVLVGCGDADPEPVTTGSSASTPASSADPDTTTIDGVVMGVLDYPAFTFEVPITWSANGAFVTKGSQGVSVWDVGEVPRDPCHWSSTMSDPGPTVDDLVGALTTQRYRHATEPTEVTLSGYQGRFLELSVPDDWVVTGDADFKGCDVEPSNGHRDFVSWWGNGEGERYLLVAGQVEMVWILDVDGQRLVIDATYPPDTADADRAELMSVVDSLRVTGQAT